MKTIREFQQKLIEVSHVQMGIHLPKLWNLEVQFWASILKTIRKIGHENGSKL